MNFLLHQSVLLTKRSQKVKNLNSIVWSCYWKRNLKKENESEINILISSRVYDANFFEINQQVSNIFIKQQKIIHNDQWLLSTKKRENADDKKK